MGDISTKKYDDIIFLHQEDFGWRPRLGDTEVYVSDEADVLSSEQMEDKFCYRERKTSEGSEYSNQQMGIFIEENMNLKFGKT